MSNLSPIFRLSVGLILLTISLLLVGDLLGLTPNQTRAELKARKSIAETLAVQVSSDISAGRMEAVIATARALQQRNDDVFSVALRRADGRLVAFAGDHVEHWDPAIGDRSTSSHVQVPIHSDGEPWGRVEVSFRPLEGVVASLFSGGSIASVILFVALAGFAAYWLFLKRALKELDPTAVVPDRVRTALDVLAEGLVILDRSGRIVLVNDSFERMLGEQKTTLVGNLLAALRWRDAGNLEIEDDTLLPWQQLLDNGEVPAPAQLALVNRAKEHMTFAVNCSPVKAPDGELRGVVVTFDDLTELEHKNSELERALQRLEHSQREITRQNRELHVLATRDALTGVLNRRSLFEGMSTLMAECAEVGDPISVVMLDIDHFKSINDRFGHATGDKVIKLLADILTQTCRAEDLVGRYGGEEFCIVMPGVGETRAAEIAEEMRTIVHDGKSARFTSAIRISASFGVADDDGDGLTASALVDLADKALYRAKDAGRNRVVRWSQVGKREPTAMDAQNTSNTEPAKISSRPGDVERDDGLEKENALLRARIADLERVVGDQLGGSALVVDQGTGLPNRIVLLDRIGQAVERSRRNGAKLAVLCVDVDAIRLVRTTQGMAIADKLTKAVGGRLRGAVRSVDTVAVPGAEQLAASVSGTENGEFVVLLTDIARAESATWITQRIFSALEAVAEVDGSEILLDARIGISIFPNDADAADDLLTCAATALREAQKTGDRHVSLYYSKTMNERSNEQLRMQTQLARALDREEFYLEYQPSVDLHEGCITGLEALLRWRHPERGVVRPDTFIPIAEHAGLIDRIGDWVIDTAARQLKHWQEMGCGDLTISVNFSALQFRRVDLVTRVEKTIRDSGLDPAAFIVEITESTLIHNLDTAVGIVEGMSRAGMKIALDDFGTGYSSLSYLKRFPIDIVKIDRSFLRDFPAEAHDTEIVSAIVAIAHNLGLRVVAEGVETERQFQVLRNLLCDEIQGFLFSKPLSRERATAMLLNPSRIRRLLNGMQPSAVSLGPLDPVVAGVINVNARSDRVVAKQ